MASKNPVTDAPSTIVMEYYSATHKKRFITYETPEHTLIIEKYLGTKYTKKKPILVFSATHLEAYLNKN